MNRLGVPDFVGGAVDGACPNWWKQGCGCNACFGTVADVLEMVSPVVEQIGTCIWILGSPLAFPIIFCFPSEPHTRESSGYAIGMMEALMAGYGTSLYAEPAIFLVILLVLLVRPYGLLGDYESERR